MSNKIPFNRQEVREAVKTLGLGPDSFRELTGAEETDLLGQFEAEFLTTPGLCWWWEAFRMPTTARQFTDGRGFERLTEIVPDPGQTVWLVVEEASTRGFGVFEATVEASQSVVGECAAFEYYLISKDFGWLVCENHHDVMIASGIAGERLGALR